jgi:hypothetical protein
VALFTLKVDVRTRNAGQLYELWSRLQDFSVVFANIIAEWARGNERKFDAAMGQEASGVAQPPVVWEALTPGYMKRKRREGYPDALMQRTGALRDALTARGAFAEFIDAHRAVFGKPLDPDAAAHAAYNRDTRPTIFLGRSDRQMIRREVSRYLNFGGDYKHVMFDRASRASVLQAETAQMDIDFAQTVATA